MASEKDEAFLSFKLNAISLAFTCGALLLLALAALVVLPLIIDYLWPTGATQWLVELGKWSVPLLA